MRFDDFDRFFKDGCEVFSSVTAKSSGDIFPDHVSGPRPSSDICRSTSHLLYYSDLFYKQAAPFSGKAGALARYAQVLTGASTCNAVNRFNNRSVKFFYIAKVPHLLVPQQVNAYAGQLGGRVLALAVAHKVAAIALFDAGFRRRQVALKFFGVK